MARLLHDRYLECANDQAWDLATGHTIPYSAITRSAPGADSGLARLAEVLEHGRDGTPRCLTFDVPPGRSLSKYIGAAADEARLRGYVAIAADAYLRLRHVLDEELRDRALLLIGRPSTPEGACQSALVEAAARCSRPHLLLMLKARAAARGPIAIDRVREARPAYAVGSKPPAVPMRPDDVTRHIERRGRAIAFISDGRHAAAERLLRDVAGALVRRRAFAAAADTWIMLGRLLLERGRAQHADEAFGEAASHAEAGHQEPLAMTARIWQAAARTDMGRLTAAESLCRAVLLTSSLDAAERQRAEATLARVLLWQGRTDDAAELGSMRSDARPATDPYVQAMAVRIHLERGDTFEAGQRARALLIAVDRGEDLVARIIGLSAHLRVLIAAGDLTLAGETLATIRATTRQSRSPLRQARVELLWVDALRRAGRAKESTPILRRLERICRAAPPQLREAIQRRLRGTASPAMMVRRTGSSVTSAATTLVAIAQREDSDRDALAGVFGFVSQALGSSRLDLWSADAGPVTNLLGIGSNPPTRLGTRVLESGIPIGPEQGDTCNEVGIPVRLGARLVGAVTARWPSDVTPRSDAADLIQLAAAVVAPRLESWLDAGRAETKAATAIPELVGTSAAMTAIRRAVTRAAASPFNVLIDGESGVGKELVARAIHQLSPRRERRFCDVNCAALPDELIESELFGHTRGAFTGALTERPGLVEEADGGTLFLDEVLDLSPRAQAKLLRVVQQQEVRRVGETFSRHVDVRFVSAANRDIRAETSAGRFRQDLLYRLEVIRIHIPPLRERPEDIPLLAAHFWQGAAARVGTSATLGHGVVTALARYHWPGNVRELQNVMAALAVAAPSRGQVRPALLPPTVTGATMVSSGRLAHARAQFERRFVEVALARAAGSRSQAARELGLSRQGLLKLLNRLGLA